MAQEAPVLPVDLLPAMVQASGIASAWNPASGAVKASRGDQPPKGRATGPPSAGHRIAIAGRNASSVWVEEDPQVEVAAVARSVLVTAARSIPWLRFGGRHQLEDGSKAGNRIPAESATVVAERIQYEPFGRALSDRPEDGPARHAENASGSTLLQEIFQSVRDALRYPLTWFLVLLLVAGILIASAVGRRGEK